MEYKEDLKYTIIELLGLGLDANYKKWKNAIWDWEFNENPFVTDLSPFIVLMNEGKVIGFNGSIPVIVRYKDEKINALWSCDTILDQKFRGKGYGKKLLHAIQVNKPLVLGLGISDAAAPILRKNGWKVNREIDEFMYVNKIISLKCIIKKCIQYYKIFQNIFKRIQISNLNASIINASNAPEEIDALWHRVENGYSKIVVRNYSYIKWKYGNHPLAKYKLIVVKRNEGLVGVGVFRQNEKKSILVDYVGPSKDIQIKYLILSKFTKACANSELLDCICTDGEFKTCLEYLGYRQLKSKPRFYVCSNIENDHDPEGDWFVMTGDSDGDLLGAARESYKLPESL